LIGEKPNESPSTLSGNQDTPFKLNEVMSQHIRRVLEMTKGKVHGKGGAAELLGINPSTLRNRMNQLGIPYGRKSAEKVKGQNAIN
jgi:DNA-binding NtrC family response regulator